MTLSSDALHLALSAPSVSALREASARVRHDLATAARPEEVCRDAHRRDRFQPFRIAATGSSKEHLLRSIDRAVENVSALRPHLEEPRIAFLFAGQGVQYAGMGRTLYEREATFRASFNDVADRLRNAGAADVRSFLADTHDSELIHFTTHTQPLLFAFEFALTHTLLTWGVRPSFLLGHSLGELVAWCVAGSLSIDDACRVVVARANTMSRIPTEGAMATVFATESDLRSLLERHGGRVSIAGYNSPTNLAVAGEVIAMDQFLAELDSLGVEYSRLKISFGAHSPLIDPVLNDFAAAISSCEFKDATLPVVSNVTGKATTSAPTASYFRAHAREPVRFSESVKTLESEHVECFVSVAPHPTLLRLLRANTNRGTLVATLERGGDDVAQMMSALDALYLRGVNVRFSDVTFDAHSSGTA